MKDNRTGSHQIAVAAALVALTLAASSAWALRMSVMPDEIQTKTLEPVERRISVKLPLQQPVFHWEFMSREALLAGRLVLRITRGESTEEIVIFDKGKFSEGWDALTFGDVERKRGEVYFAFESATKYLTAPGDKLEIELTVASNLDGIGPVQTGVLPAGKYVSRGAYSGLIDVDSHIDALFHKGTGGPLTDEQQAKLDKWHEINDYKAWLENWETQWPLRITGDTGWLPEDQAAAHRQLIDRLTMQEAAEGSHK